MSNDKVAIAEEDPRTNFAVVIKMHTPDAHKTLSDPGLIREWVGATLDRHHLQEEIDYTPDVYRTEAETDSITERVTALEQRLSLAEAERDALLAENKRLEDLVADLSNDAGIQAQVDAFEVLLAENRRLKAPVTDEEALEYGDDEIGWLEREDINALIAARADAKEKA